MQKKWNKLLPYDLISLFFCVYYLIIFQAIYDLLGEENRKGENSPSKRVEKIMNKLDINGDRSLTKDEFINGCLQDDFLKNLLAPNA